MREEKFHPIGQGKLPKPVILSSEDSFKNTGDASWVKTTGVIIGVKSQGKKIEMYLQASPNRTLKLIALHGSPASAAALLGCTAEVAGVYGLDLDSSLTTQPAKMSSG